jgi:hypothetical protein
MLTMDGLGISVTAAVAMNLRRRALRARCDCCAGEFAEGAGSSAAQHRAATGSGGASPRLSIVPRLAVSPATQANRIRTGFQ